MNSNSLFKTDYPEYRQCYEELERVANEFRALQEALKGALDQFERSRVNGKMDIFLLQNKLFLRLKLKSEASSLPINATKSSCGSVKGIMT